VSAGVFATVVVAAAMGTIGLNLGFVVAIVALATAAAIWTEVRRQRPPSPTRTRTLAANGAVLLVAAFGLMQLVPYGRAHSNPAVTAEPQWATPETRDLMVRACYACHSNEVDWPWYSDVAPISWVITNHVNEGRDEINYSEFDRGHGEGGDTLEVILEGEMPPAYFTLFGLNGEANLSDAEWSTLVEGLRATPRLSEQGERGGDDHEDDDHEEEDDD